MDETFQIANRYELKELELNSLLEITQAINENVAEDSLYKIYNFTLRANLSLSKLLLLVKDGGNWSTKVQFGTEREYLAYQLDASLSEKSVISHREALVNTHFNEFEVGIPVFHKGNLLAMVFLGGIAVNGHTKSLENRLNFIQALTNITMVAIENKKMARERLERGVYEKEMEIAKKVQQLLFPKCLPVSKNFKISAHYSPHSTVGGDYYDWVEIDENRKMICIADVSGKGVPAALLMSNFQASLRTLLRKTTDLQELINDLNYQVFQSANGENFITFFIAILDSRDKKVAYVNAGHNPPFLIQDNAIIDLNIGTLVLGAFEKLPFLEIGELPLTSSQMFFLYTDGLTEAFNASEEEFGPERLKLLLQDLKIDDPEIVVKNVLVNVADFVGDRPYSDDITLLACNFLV
ncbi:MAG: sigma-B regulation protein RsbU (phosphoserine phosphatase) [Marivirga sp.]|jgi:sigma-B regulation protein RsbU (phosphoserine phosphatase)